MKFRTKRSNNSNQSQYRRSSQQSLDNTPSKLAHQKSKILEMTPQQQQLNNITNDVLRQGKILQMNLHGDNSNTFVRIFTPGSKSKLANSKKQPEYFGCDIKKLSPEERDGLNYIKSQLDLKINQEETIKTLKLKLLGIQRTNNKPFEKPIIKHKRYLSEMTNQQANVITKPNSIQNISDVHRFALELNHILEKSSPKLRHKKLKPLKINPKGNYPEMDSAQADKWIEIHKIKGLNIPSERPYQIKNIQKYDVAFDEYQKKKSDKKLQKNAKIKFGYQKETLIKEYQNQLLNSLKISPKFKQNIVKSFDFINKQASKTDL